MREILFKAKRVDNGEWVYGYLLAYGIHNFIVSQKDFLAYEKSDVLPATSELRTFGNRVEKETICQCTGLTDKNSVNIFEGDIVELFGGRYEITFECGTSGIAKSNLINWDNIERHIEPYTGCKNSPHFCQCDNFVSLWEIYWNFNEDENSLYCIKVIGNVFDNPKLLKVED